MIAQSSVLAMNDARNEAAISAKSSAMSSDCLISLNGVPFFVRRNCEK